jgi:segregation and condensation protein B
MIIGITKMYKEIADLIGFEDYEMVNPYKEKCNCDFLIISNGYKERVKKLNPNAEIFEVRSATFKDLIESLKELEKLGFGNKEKINNSIEFLKNKEKEIKKLSKNLNAKVNPKTDFVRKVVEDLDLEISDDGILIIPDYLFDGKERDDAIILKTHNYDLGLVERIEDRYLQIINNLRGFYERTH